MLLVGMIAAFLAAALHVFIFYIESFAWTTRAPSVFSMDRESAEATKEMPSIRASTTSSSPSRPSLASPFTTWHRTLLA